MLNRDDILNADDLKTEIVPVPEWGGEVMILEMTGAMKDEYEEHIIATPAKDRARMVRARMVAMSVVNAETKELEFSLQDVEALAKKSGNALTRVFKAAAYLNAVTEDAVEDAAKN